MAQNINILNELNEIKSSLGKIGAENVYVVPDGYFENLASQVLNRIKAIEAPDAKEELKHLSPFLSNMSRQTPYGVPQGYFEELSNNLSFVTTGSELNAKEELIALSPLLSSLKKETPYTVPQDYFETIGKPEVKAKVISFSSHKWLRYAAAAVVMGFIATIFLVTQNKNKVDPNADSYAWIKKNVKKVSTDELDEFIELTDINNAVASTQKTDEIKNLIKDVPEKEIQQLLNDAEVLYDATGDEMIVN